MYIVYYDESGDDGYPNYSSPLFVLTALYLHKQFWKNCFLELSNFRRWLRQNYGFPVKMEIHTKDFLLNKNPYRILCLSDDKRLDIVDNYCGVIGRLGVQSIQIINVVINKTSIQSGKYDILDRALTYSIQRIENDLDKNASHCNFIVITDPGRVGKMRRIARRLQKINYIPSKYGPGSSRREISRMIEDPLPKESDQSYFIQIADFVSYLVHLYILTKLKISSLPNRLPISIDNGKILEWMEMIKPALNLAASSNDEYGVVCYPK